MIRRTILWLSHRIKGNKLYLPIWFSLQWPDTGKNCLWTSERVYRKMLLGKHKIMLKEGEDTCWAAETTGERLQEMETSITAEKLMVEASDQSVMIVKTTGQNGTVNRGCGLMVKCTKENVAQRMDRSVEGVVGETFLASPFQVRPCTCEQSKNFSGAKQSVKEKVMTLTCEAEEGEVPVSLVHQATYAICTVMLVNGRKIRFHADTGTSTWRPLRLASPTEGISNKKNAAFVRFIHSPTEWNVRLGSHQSDN